MMTNRRRRKKAATVCVQKWCLEMGREEKVARQINKTQCGGYWERSHMWFMSLGSKKTCQGRRRRKKRRLLC